MDVPLYANELNPFGLSAERKQRIIDFMNNYHANNKLIKTTESVASTDDDASEASTDQSIELDDASVDTSLDTSIDQSIIIQTSEEDETQRRIQKHFQDFEKYAKFNSYRVVQYSIKISAERLIDRAKKQSSSQSSCSDDCSDDQLIKQIEI